MVADGAAWSDGYLGEHIAFAVQLRFTQQMFNLDFTLAVGFILCMSNTEPVIRLNVETRQDKALLEEKTAELLKEIRG